MVVTSGASAGVGSRVHVSIDGAHRGTFTLTSRLRPETGRMIGRSVVAAWADSLDFDAVLVPPSATFVEALQKTAEAFKRFSAVFGEEVQHDDD